MLGWVLNLGFAGGGIMPPAPVQQDRLNALRHAMHGGVMTLLLLLALRG